MTESQVLELSSAAFSDQKQEARSKVEQLRYKLRPTWVASTCKQNEPKLLLLFYKCFSQQRRWYWKYPGTENGVGLHSICHTAQHLAALHRSPGTWSSPLPTSSPLLLNNTAQSLIQPQHCESQSFQVLRKFRLSFCFSGHLWLLELTFTFWTELFTERIIINKIVFISSQGC